MVTKNHLQQPLSQNTAFQKKNLIMDLATKSC